MGQLAQGVGKKIKGTDKISFISYRDIPPEHRGDVTHGLVVVDYRPQKY